MKGPRPQDSAKPPVTRKDRTLATRRRMLEAGYQLLCEVGYGAATLAAIARRAGVAEQTLYFTFGSKPAIVNEILHAAVVGFDVWSPDLDGAVQRDHLATARDQVPWFRPFEDEPDPRRALATYVNGTIAILARVAPLEAAVNGLGVPELKPTLELSERLRGEASLMIVRALKAKGQGLRRGLSLQRAVDIFHVLTSPLLFHQLVAGRGWSPTQAGSWLAATLGDQLLAQPGR